MTAMNISLRSLCKPLGALLLLACLPAAAAKVYKTVDANGVVSFSDTQPADASEVELLEIEVTEPQLSATDQQRLEDMRETTDRMAADRRARELHRAELRQQRTPAQTQVVEVGSGDDGYANGYSGYYPYPVRRPGWRPRPTHPIARPPGYRPPMRPPLGIQPRPQPAKPIIDYPASLVRKSYSPEVRAAFER